MLLSEDMTEWSVSIKKYVRNISVKQKCSHRCQMVRCAVEEAGRCNAEIIRCHTSSKNALEDILETACAAV